MSICNKIYTLNKIQQKVDHYDTVILNVKKKIKQKQIIVCSLQSLQQLLLLEIYSVKFSIFLILFLKLESTTVLKKLFVIGGSLLSKQDFTYPEDDDVENSVVCLPRALHCMAGCMLFFYYYFLCTPNSSD